MGFGLATHKAQRGRQVNWVGDHITDASNSTRIHIKEEFLNDLREQTVQLLKNSVVGLKALRSYAGGRAPYSESVCVY